MTDKDEASESDAGNVEVIEGFYDWGLGMVVTADCLGQSYQTVLAGRPLIVTLPAFDGAVFAEPPLRYKRPDNYVDVDPPNPWGELRSFDKAEDGTPIPILACIKRVRLHFSVTRAGAADPFRATARQSVVAVVGRIELLDRGNDGPRPGESWRPPAEAAANLPPLGR